MNQSFYSNIFGVMRCSALEIVPKFLLKKATYKTKSTTSHLEAGSQHPWLEPSKPNNHTRRSALKDCSKRLPVSGLVFDPTLHMSLKETCFNRHTSAIVKRSDWHCISRLGTFSDSRIRCCNDHCLSTSWSDWK